jgi:1,3-beta-glucan synthase
VIRYAILYFTLLVVFIALIAGPAVVGKIMGESLSKTIEKMIPLEGLVQPNYLDHDNTNSTSATGIKAPGYTGAGLTMTGSKRVEASATGKIKLF